MPQTCGTYAKPQPSENDNQKPIYGKIVHTMLIKFVLHKFNACTNFSATN